jgi:hypothetical protein
LTVSELRKPSSSRRSASTLTLPARSPGYPRAGQGEPGEAGYPQVGALVEAAVEQLDGHPDLGPDEAQLATHPGAADPHRWRRGAGGRRGQQRDEQRGVDGRPAQIELAPAGDGVAELRPHRAHDRLSLRRDVSTSRPGFPVSCPGPHPAGPLPFAP